MKKLAIVVGAIFVVVGLWVFYWKYDTTPRAPHPPLGSEPYLPWGAVLSEGPLPFDEWRELRHQELEKELTPGPKEILVISGGGAKGAFGAGILNGWTERGDRPSFDVVTGVSVGSLQSVFAFLGPDFDNELKAVFARHEHLSEVAFWSRPKGALFEVEPFKATIRKHYDERVLKAVAARHAEGARLYVGSTNLDGQEFVIWDMGAIASSGRPEALETFRTVLLASCSMPMVFPPVYFDLEAENQKFDQMHVDGGTRMPLFLPKFVLNSTGGSGHVYVILNHAFHSGQRRRAVDADLPGIGVATFRTLLEDKLLGELQIIKEQSQTEGLSFSITAIDSAWNEVTFAMRPEDTVRDPKELFERAKSLIQTDGWQETIAERSPKGKEKHETKSN